MIAIDGSATYRIRFRRKLSVPLRKGGDCFGSGDRTRGPEMASFRFAAKTASVQASLQLKISTHVADHGQDNGPLRSQQENCGPTSPRRIAGQSFSGLIRCLWFSEISENVSHTLLLSFQPRGCVGRFLKLLGRLDRWRAFYPGMMACLHLLARFISSGGSSDPLKAPSDRQHWLNRTGLFIVIVPAQPPRNGPASLPLFIRTRL